MGEQEIDIGGVDLGRHVRLQGHRFQILAGASPIVDPAAEARRQHALRDRQRLLLAEALQKFERDAPTSRLRPGGEQPRGEIGVFGCHGALAGRDFAERLQ